MFKTANKKNNNGNNANDDDDDNLTAEELHRWRGRRPGAFASGFCILFTHSNSIDILLIISAKPDDFSFRFPSVYAFHLTILSLFLEFHPWLIFIRSFFTFVSYRQFFQLTIFFRIVENHIKKRIRLFFGSKLCDSPPMFNCCLVLFRERFF